MQGDDTIDAFNLNALVRAISFDFQRWVSWMFLFFVKDVFYYVEKIRFFFSGRLESTISACIFSKRFRNVLTKNNAYLAIVIK